MPAKAKIAGMARSYLKPMRNRYSFVFVQSLSFPRPQKNRRGRRRFDVLKKTRLGVTAAD